MHLTDSHSNLLAKSFDDGRIRIPLVALATSILWLGLLTICGVLLNRSSAVSSVQPPVQISLMDSPGLAGGGGGSSVGIAKDSSRSIATPNTEKAPSRSNPPLVRPKAIQAARERQFEATKSYTPIRRIKVANHSSSDQAVPSFAKAEASSTNLSGAISGSGAALETSGTRGTSSGAGSGSGGAGSGIGSGGGFGNGGSGPHAIYAPLPTIPDDMRDEVMRASAVVRFHVYCDGSAQVTLVTSTDYSELDDLILDTLRQWRFAPALRDGVKIEADAEVRLLVTVQ